MGKEILYYYIIIILTKEYMYWTLNISRPEPPIIFKKSQIVKKIDIYL